MKRGRTKKADPLKWIRVRLLVMAGLLGACFLLMAGQAFRLQVLQGDDLRRKAEVQYKKDSEDSSKRGTIYDRNLAELAATVDVESICCYPGQIDSTNKTASALARMLNIDKASLKERLSSERKFMWVKRHASPTEIAEARKLNLAGIDFVAEGRRFYPLKGLAGQLLGFCGTDGRGLEGLEFYYDSLLRARQGKRTVLKDALGRDFDAEWVSPGIIPEYNAVLAIDKNIQYIAENVLYEGVREFSAKSGIVVAMAPRTGAILAVANVPGFNPNAFYQYEQWLWRNRAITDTFEPGSTFKVFTAASALESGVCSPVSEFYCEDGAYKIGGKVVHDVRSHGTLSLEDILKYSSNIGAAKVGEMMGAAYLYQKLRDFGFGERLGIDFPAEAGGRLPPVDDWSKLDAGAICFGQGVSVSTLQLAAAACAIANHGLLMKPYLLECVTDMQGRVVKRFQPVAIRQVISPKNARLLARMMERTIEVGGTGVKAALRGYRVAGKTGTAQKADRVRGGYADDKYIASFVGFAPADDPQIVIAVVIDEPQKEHYGGVVAAPIFKGIAEAALRHLKISPEPVEVEAGSPAEGVSNDYRQAGESLSASREAPAAG